MTLVWASLLLLLGVLVMSAPAVAHHHTTHRLPRFGPCHIRGSKLLYHDARVEVVRGPPLFIEGAEREPSEAMWKVYSCVPRGRAHYLLSIGWVDRWFGNSIDHVTLAGRFGAFHVVESSSIDIFDHVAVFDLATGHRVAQDVGDSTYFRVFTALVLDKAGAAAWTYSTVTHDPNQKGQPPVALYGASTTHAAAVLDTGTIDSTSVTVSATTVSWTNAGTPRQADLSGP
ncbi:MAG: hypothetical protein ACHQAV_00920 [Solirubrobacterales bacterium]